MKKTLYVISYDIADNYNRSKVAGILEDCGIRVQKSVFECQLKKKSILELKTAISNYINPKTDSLIVYRLCESCKHQKKVYGVTPKVTMDEEICIL